MYTSLQNIPTQQNTYDCGVFVLEVRVCCPCLFSYEIVTHNNYLFLKIFSMPGVSCLKFQ